MIPSKFEYQNEMIIPLQSPLMKAGHYIEFPDNEKLYIILDTNNITMKIAEVNNFGHLKRKIRNIYLLLKIFYLDTKLNLLNLFL